MKRAALYARVSTERQKDEQTIETQIHEIKQKIQADGCTLIDDCTYQDAGWSGAILERPDLDRLRQDARESKFDVLYVFDRGRLSRKFVYQEILIEELTKYGVEFKSLHDVNGSTPEEQLMGSVMGVFHEYERVKIAERFRLGKLNKVRNGKLLGYMAPYGYDYIPVKGKGLNKINGRFVINDDEAEVVRMMYEWVGIEGISLREVIRRLYEYKVPPKKQKRPNWTKGPVSRLLQNESYTGRHYYYKCEAIVPQNPMAATTKKYHRRVTNKTSRRRRDKDEWLMVKIPRIIDDDLFNRVQDQLKLNSKYNKRNKINPYLVSGLIYCPCGERRVGDGCNDKRYYRCTARLHSFPLPNPCGSAGINVTVLDAVCWEKLTELLTQPELVEEQIARYMKTRSKQMQVEPSEDDIKQNLKALELEESRYAKMYGQAMMSEDVYEERIRSVLERREKLNKQIALQDDTTEQITQIDPKQLVEPFRELLQNMDFDAKQFTTRKIVDKIIATKEEVTICGFIPLIDNSASRKVKYGPIYRHRRPPQRRQIYPF